MQTCVAALRLPGQMSVEQVAGCWWNVWPDGVECADRAVPIDYNWCESQTHPWALGRKNWLFAGSLRSGQRAAAIMSLIQSARNNGHDPYAYLKDVLTRLPTQRVSEITELLPHRWRPV